MSAKQSQTAGPNKMLSQFPAIELIVPSPKPLGDSFPSDLRTSLVWRADLLLSRVFVPSRMGWNFRPRKPLRLFKGPAIAVLCRCTDLRKEGDLPCYKSHWVGWLLAQFGWFAL